jgi:uncharacterized protein
VNGGVLNALYLVAEAYEKGSGVEKDDVKATKYYEAAAMTGDPLSQFKLGYRLLRGLGCKQNITRAFSMQLESAQQNFAPAMHNVADHYFNGIGVPQSFENAAKWFEKAATEGNVPESGINLAVMYKDGLGVQHDPKKAIEILARFAPYHAPSQQLLLEFKAEANIII